MQAFKELLIWKKAIVISKLVFEMNKSLPDIERYNLCSQMSRSALSIPSNTAEGAGRSSKKEFLQFLNIALGSSFELETQLILCKEFNYVSEHLYDTLTDEIHQLQKMINKFMQLLRKQNSFDK